MSKISDVYGMKRGWMDHDVLRENKYDKRSAWAWLIENAAWKDHRRTWRSDRPPVDLKRGQLIAAIRVMAAEWRWSKDRVDRFLKILKNESMIDIKTATGICIITICNYDDYQLTPGFLKDADKDAAKDADKDTDKDADKDNKNKDIIQNRNKSKNKENNSVGDQAVLIDGLPVQHKEPSRFNSEFWPLCPRKRGKAKAEDEYEKARLRDTQENIIAGMRAHRREYEDDKRPPEEKDQFYKWPQGWLSADRWRDYVEPVDDNAGEDENPDFTKMTDRERSEWILRRAGIE